MWIGLSDAQIESLCANVDAVARILVEMFIDEHSESTNATQQELAVRGKRA